METEKDTHTVTSNPFKNESVLLHVLLEISCNTVSSKLKNKACPTCKPFWYIKLIHPAFLYSTNNPVISVIKVLKVVCWCYLVFQKIIQAHTCEIDYLCRRCLIKRVLLLFSLQ